MHNNRINNIGMIYNLTVMLVYNCNLPDDRSCLNSLLRLFMPISYHFSMAELQCIYDNAECIRLIWASIISASAVNSVVVVVNSHKYNSQWHTNHYNSIFIYLFICKLHPYIHVQYNRITSVDYAVLPIYHSVIHTFVSRIPT